MRRADWVARLRETVQAWQAAPFKYGTTDCGRFAATCVDAITGRDTLLSLGYVDQRTARRFLAREGGMTAAVTRRLGPASNLPALPRRGDVCLVDGHDGPSLGVALGTAVAVLTEDGLEYAPVSAVQLHWRVD